MKHIFILLLMLAVFPCQADDTPANGGNTSQAEDSASKSDNGDASQAAGKSSKSDEGKKPAGGDEEEPDCD